MAKLIINNTEYTLPDQSSITEVCEKAGVPFNCNSGVCGSCQIRVLSGAEYLNALTEDEKNLGLDTERRLACQCVIQGGLVKVEF